MNCWGLSCWSSEKGNNVNSAISAGERSKIERRSRLRSKTKERKVYVKRQFFFKKVGNELSYKVLMGGN